MKNRWTLLRGQIEAVSEKAVLLIMDGQHNGKIWVPRSVIADGHVAHRGQRNLLLETRWWRRHQQSQKHVDQMLKKIINQQAKGTLP